MSGERTLPGLGLTGFWTAGDNSWKPGMDANLRVLSAVVQLRAKSRVSPFPFDDSNSTAFVDGDIYIVPASDSNSLQDSNSNPHHNYIAIHDAGDWIYVAPQTGWIAYIVDEDIHISFGASGWEELAGGGAGGSVDATDVTYSSEDGGDSNSTQINVQDALDDLYERVRAAGGGGGGSALIGFSGATGGAGISSSTSAFATKAIYFTPSRDVTITAIWAIIDPTGTDSEHYAAFIAEVQGFTGSDQVTSVLGTTSDFATSSNGFAEGVEFPFVSPVTMIAGHKYIVAVYLNDALDSNSAGNGTAVCRVSGVQWGNTDSWVPNCPGFMDQASGVNYNTSGVTVGQTRSGRDGSVHYCIWMNGYWEP